MIRELNEKLRIPNAPNKKLRQNISKVQAVS